METSVCDACCPPSPVACQTNALAWAVYMRSRDAIAADDVRLLAELLPSQTMHNCDFAMWPMQKQLLHWCAERGAGNCLKYLLALLPATACNSLNNKNATPLHVAAYYGQLEMVEALLASGADMSIQNMERETPGEAAFAGERNYRSPDAFAAVVALLQGDRGHRGGRMQAPSAADGGMGGQDGAAAPGA